MTGEPTAMAHPPPVPPGASPAEAPTDLPPGRVLTVPNAITAVRLACLPLFLYLLFGRDDRYGAAWLLGALGATDWVDGFVARRFHQVSAVGKVLDPVADRLLLGTAIVSILLVDAAPRWIAGLVLGRELVVAATSLGLAAAGATRIDVTWVGKAGTFANLFAFPLFLGGSSTGPGNEVFMVLAWVFALPGVGLSWYAAAAYIPAARRALRVGRHSQIDPTRGAPT